MKKLTQHSFFKAALVVTTLFLGYSINAVAKQLVTDDVQVSIRGDHNDKTYVVDGKTFTWDDLNESQKERVSEVEKRLEKALEKVNIDEEAMSQLEEEITAEVESLMNIEELKQLENLDNLDNMTLREIEEHAEKVALAVKENEPRIKAIEARFEHMVDIDTTEIDAIAEEMELVLIQVAAELN